MGRFDFKGNPVAESLLRRMCALTAHRGPDDEGVYLHGPVGLGSRRLSIIDVAGGHQPISNEDGSIWLVFNGEIYNFQELHDELERKGHRFDTRTDTEVIVHLYEEMGEACVQRLNGMFAFAIWDARRRRLVLARDRLGKKPLHYAVTRGGIVFASEVAPILEDPEVPRRINLLALHQYLHLAYVPGPLTIFQDVMKLPPAHLMVVENEKMIVRRYWDVDFGDKRALTPAVWADEVMALLQEAVRIRMVADVPLGAMLSGGIDSSLVVALMTRYSSLPVKTFSIGFQDTDYNELPHARRVAEHLGTEHYEEVVCPDAASVLPKLVWHYGEPFGDESCIPTYYLSRLARRQVTVALSGDGGDESFGGYPRLPQYVSFSAANSLRGLLSSEIRDIAHDAHPLAAALSPRRWSAFGKELVFRLDEITHPMERYSHAWTVWKECSGMPLMPQAQAGVARQRVFGALEDGWQRTRGWDPLDRLLYLDLQTYLPDDLQVKMDIASMAASLEVRSPLLDYRLVELAARMPSSLKFEGGQTKVLLRSLAGTLMPPGITNRGKWGFSVPIGRWLRHDLRPMMEDLLLDATCRQRGIFDPPRVQRMVSEHLGGLRDNGRYLWLLLVFELWARVFLDCHRDVPLQPSWTASHV